MPDTNINVSEVVHREYPFEEKQIDKPVMLGVKETAYNFHIAVHYARQLALTGKVRAVRAGNKILINQQSVIDYFNSCTLTDQSKPEQAGAIKPIEAKLI